MNLRKLCLGLAFITFDQLLLTNAKDQKTFYLQSPLLKIADEKKIFHGPILDILQTRANIVKLIKGEQQWSGAIINLDVADSHSTIEVYAQRPEIIYGASFIALSCDHELASTIAHPDYAQAVDNFIHKKSNTIYHRQMHATTEAVFTGSYAIHPLTQAQLPIYISDYAIECFDVRKSKARLGVPAHNSKDFEFAHLYNLPIHIVVDVQKQLKGQKDDFGPVVAAPLLDKQGSLTEAYLGEYLPCVIINSDVLNNMALKDAALYVINYLEQHNIGHAYTETLRYDYNGEKYSVQELAKIEATLYKNIASNAQTDELKQELKMALNYIQADFLAIGEKFLINIKNTRQLMTILIEEDCQLRQNNDCYLLQWTHLKGEFNEKEIFRRDIISIRSFTTFCKDLVNFLSDLAHSCPRALENVQKQNQ